MNTIASLAFGVVFLAVIRLLFKLTPRSASESTKRHLVALSLILSLVAFFVQARLVSSIEGLNEWLQILITIWPSIIYMFMLHKFVRCQKIHPR